MINGLVRTFLHTPLLALILVGALAVFGWQALERNPKDAIPDIAENQVIVFSEWMGRSPKDVDEQVTYPLTVALQGVPEVKEIRATSGFGWSIVYVVFKDDTEFYWARSRVLERLNVAQGQLPTGVTPRLGPDATALGQIFWYTVENGWYSPDRPGLRFAEDGVLTAASRSMLIESDSQLAEQVDAAEPFIDPISGSSLIFSQLPLDRLRSMQDFDVKLALESVEGVSEVASIGGYVRQYQIDVNPEALRAFQAPLARLVAAVNSANIDVGAKVVEENGMEILIRGIGFLGGEQRSAAERVDREAAVIRDLENIVIHADNGTPVYMHQVATVNVGPDFRRGALDKLGAEAVGGAVTMRFGENPLTVIERVKNKIDIIERGLPPGVRVNAFYDRSKLIHETMGTLTAALTQELAITIVAVVLFLLHFRSSLVIAVTLPLAVLFAFICMQALKLPSNIMSLAGIAIAIGTMVDMGIVMLENIYQYLTDHRAEYTRVETDARGRPREIIDHGRRGELVPRGRHGSRLGHSHRDQHDGGLVRTGLLSGRTGRQAVHAAGLDEDVLHGWCRDSRVNGGPAAGRRAAQESSRKPAIRAGSRGRDWRRVGHGMGKRRSDPSATARIHQRHRGLSRLVDDVHGRHDRSGDGAGGLRHVARAHQADRAESDQSVHSLRVRADAALDPAP